jgi:Fic family protein
MLAQPMRLHFPLRLPQLDSASQLRCRGIVATHARLNAEPACDAEKLSAALAKARLRPESLQLRDELSDVFNAPRIDKLELKSLFEKRAFESLLKVDVLAACSTTAGFTQLLRDTHQQILPDGTTSDGVRGGPVRSLSDDEGRCVVYPPPQVLARGLEELAEAISAGFERQPGLTSIYAMVVICALHPFRNGNGRVSRVWFNWLLARASGKQVYIPLYELGEISDGGWLLALRRAQLHNEWFVIIRYVLTCLQILSRG